MTHTQPAHHLSANLHMDPALTPATLQAVGSTFADAVEKFINSPPGQIAAGGVLGGIVWKFFERSRRC